MPTDKTILIIEDDHVQLQVVSEKLKTSGFKVIEAFDGAMGLQVALSEQPDLILLDNRMPQMSGYEMLRRLREGGGWGEKVPVIFFSNVEPATKEEQNDLEAITPTAYILKSDTDLTGIVEKIKQALGVA
jgi:CheY-like chemotaxis protein